MNQMTAITEKNIENCLLETEKIIRHELVGELNKLALTLSEIQFTINTHGSDIMPEVREYYMLVCGIKKTTEDYMRSIEKEFRSFGIRLADNEEEK